MTLDLSGWLLPVLAFAVSMSATPGPNNVMVAASGATFGFGRSVPQILGISVGFPAMLALIAFGAGAPLREWPWLHDGLRWVGAAYLLWLAWHIAAARPQAAGGAASSSRPLTFVQAALFQWVNPKAWVIAAGAVVTYTNGDGAGFATQAALLTAIFLVTTILAVAMWAALGAGTARLLRTPRALRRFNMAMAALLVLSLIPMLRE
jgi:threonine/homoserine/homoserine lactone efflux protein